MMLKPRILREILESRQNNPGIRNLVKGFMVESYIEDGRQEINGGCYGKSITDTCLGRKKSERLVLETAEML